MATRLGPATAGCQLAPRARCNSPPWYPACQRGPAPAHGRGCTCRRGWRRGRRAATVGRRRPGKACDAADGRHAPQPLTRGCWGPWWPAGSSSSPEAAAGGPGKVQGVLGLGDVPPAAQAVAARTQALGAHLEELALGLSHVVHDYCGHPVASQHCKPRNFASVEQVLGRICCRQVH